MHDSPLAAWDNFYVIIGSSAAALIGLQFVVIALLAETKWRTSTKEVDAFATPTIIHFAAALLERHSRPLRMCWGGIRRRGHSAATANNKLQTGAGGLDLARDASAYRVHAARRRFSRARSTPDGVALRRRRCGVAAAVHRYPQCVGYRHLYHSRTTPGARR